MLSMKCFRGFILFGALMLNVESPVRAFDDSMSSEYWSHEKEDPNADRIIGGTSATQVVPYMVSFQMASSGWHVCGGAIISSHHVVSAGHCFYKKFPEDLTVLAGTIDKRFGIRHRIASIYRHPKFCIETFDNDIAVIKVEPEFRFTQTLHPIRLGRTYVGEHVALMVPGWGLTNRIPAERPDILQLLYQTSTTNEDCAIRWRKPIIDSQLCSVNISRTCLGDSGGPVVTVNTKEPEIVGIVSYGPADCGIEVPNVRTRLSSLLEFIDGVLKMHY